MEIYFLDTTSTTITTTTPAPTASGEGKFCIMLHIKYFSLILKKYKYCAKLILVESLT